MICFLNVIGKSQLQSSQQKEHTDLVLVTCHKTAKNPCSPPVIFWKCFGLPEHAFLWQAVQWLQTSVNPVLPKTQATGFWQCLEQKNLQPKIISLHNYFQLRTEANVVHLTPVRTNSPNIHSKEIRALHNVMPKLVCPLHTWNQELLLWIMLGLSGLKWLRGAVWVYKIGLNA